MKLYRVEHKQTHYGPFNCRTAAVPYETQSAIARRHRCQWSVYEKAEKEWEYGVVRFAMTTREQLAEVFAEAIALDAFQVIEIDVPDEWAMLCGDGQAVYHAKKVEKVRQLVKENLLKLVAESAA